MYVCGYMLSVCVSVMYFESMEYVRSCVRSVHLCCICVWSLCGVCVLCVFIWVVCVPVVFVWLLCVSVCGLCVCAFEKTGYLNYREDFKNVLLNSRRTSESNVKFEQNKCG